MIRTAFSLFFLLLIAGIILWLSQYPGTTTIELATQTISIKTGALSIALLIAVVAILTLYRGLMFFLMIPERWRHRKALQAKNSIIQGIGHTLIALASGDKLSAEKECRKLEKLDEKLPLLPLLKARHALLSEQEDEAESHFKELLKGKETSLLGYKGLFHQYFSNNQISRANGIAERAVKAHPKSEWAHHARLLTQTRGRQWDAALETLRTLRKISDNPAPLTASEVTIYIEKARIALNHESPEQAYAFAKKAIKLTPTNPLSYDFLIQALIKLDRKRKALGYIRDAWENTPSLSLLTHLKSLIPDPLKCAEFADKKALSHAGIGHLMFAQIYIDAELWGNARTALEKTPEEFQTKYFYTLSILVARRLYPNASYDSLKQKQQQATSDFCWQCNFCSYSQEHWKALCDQCESFDSLKWSQPLLQNIHNRQKLTPLPILD